MSTCLSENEDFDLVAKSKEMKAVLSKAKKIAQSDGSVLIEGESGTGKELIARFIHHLSNRGGNGFIALNCTAVPDTLIDSSLFGHEKGAFTGACNKAKGIFDAADKSSIFLDEIGDASHSFQTKLLRVLQDKTFIRVGGTKQQNVDVRIISATNSELNMLIQKCLFRNDLYHRLSTFRIYVPPLRERKEDISNLAYHFLSKYSKKYGKCVNTISHEVEKVLLKYRWPGNVRELGNVIEHSILMEENDELGLGALPENLQGTSGDLNMKPDLYFLYRDAKEEFERSYISELITSTSSIAQAARISGLTTMSLYRKMKKYDIAKKDSEKTDVAYINMNAVCTSTVIPRHQVQWGKGHATSP